jgi:diguanylate cyclase (GGDEF)-like protein/PAS domain S-box-containing protein
MRWAVIALALWVGGGRSKLNHDEIEHPTLACNDRRPMTVPAPLPANESERLRKLGALDVLDTEAEPLFDALTKAASLAVGVPIALVTLVDADRQWFKSNVGLAGATQTPRDVAFCSYTILGDDVFVVPDASADPRFSGNPLVTGEPGIRFYAGAPITLKDGLRMGALCVIDHRARALTPTQAETLRELARAVAEALDQRALARERNDALRREAEGERLRNEDRNRLANILDATHAGAWEWNLVTGELLVNKQWAEIFGYEGTELTSLSGSPLRNLKLPASGDTGNVEGKLTHPDDWQHVAERLNAYLRGTRKLFETEARMRHRDGRWMWVQTRGRISQRSEDGEPLWMYGTLVDISERKDIERKLHESESFLDRTGRVAGVGGWQVDLLSNEITWSDQTCIIHDVVPGYRPTPEEAIAYVREDQRETIQAAIRRGVADGKGWDLELPLITEKGRSIWVRIVGTVELEAGKPRYLVGAIQDITFRKRAVDALQLSERRFRKLFEESLGLICTHDLDGVILSVNPATAEALGYSVTELLARRLSDFMPAELRPAFDDYLATVRAQGIAAGLLRLVAKDGSLRTWQYHNTLDEEGEEPYVLGHALDITEREHHARHLRDWSIRDALTGCFNRRYLAEVASGLRDGDPWGCIAVDLDRFKQVNDTYGHQRGDEVLVAMGQFLSSRVRPRDIVVRAGGDEFLVLLPHTDAEQAQRIIERIEAERAQAPIGFTLGHAIRNGSESLDSALAAADARLYEIRAKRPPVSR